MKHLIRFFAVFFVLTPCFSFALHSTHTTAEDRFAAEAMEKILPKFDRGQLEPQLRSKLSFLTQSDFDQYFKYIKLKYWNSDESNFFTSIYFSLSPAISIDALFVQKSNEYAQLIQEKVPLFLSKYKEYKTEGDDFFKKLREFVAPAQSVARAPKVQLNEPLKPLANNCPNIDFESGNLTGWNLTNGYANSSGPDPFGLMAGPVYNRAFNTQTGDSIMTGGFDPLVGGNLLPKVCPGGNFSFLLGDRNTGITNSNPGNVNPAGGTDWGDASRITYSFTVSWANPIFTYKYASVLNDPTSGHTPAQYPYFRTRIYDQNGDTILCGQFLDVANTASLTALGYQPVAAYPGMLWKNWTSVVIPLGLYAGQTLTLEFTVSDCTQGGHMAYAYVEAECSRPPLTITKTCGQATLTAPAGAASYLWTGPGIVGSNTTQTINVNQGGAYSVLLTSVIGPACIVTLDTVLTLAQKPVAGFTYSAGCTPTVTFADTSKSVDVTDPIATETMYFGDGQTSNSFATSHTYATGGTYTVSLVVVTANGCKDSVSQQITTSPKPVANFTATNLCLNSAANVFTNTSTVLANIVSSVWMAGDGTSSKDTVDFKHTYNAAGTYTISLVVTNNGGCKDSIKKSVTIHPLPVADFSSLPVCLGDSTRFIDLSSTNPTIKTWAWNFGQGGANNLSSLQNPAHLYANAGTFNVILTVTTDSNCQSTKNMSVKVNPIPTAAITAPDVCIQSSTAFDGSASAVATPSSINGYTWDFGELANPSNTATGATANHTYLSPGPYTVTLEVSSSDACSDTAKKVVNVWPAADPHFTVPDVCLGQNSVFTDATILSSGNILSYSWSFGDGPPAGTSAIQSPTYAYGSSGTYNVTLVVITNNNCTTQVTQPALVNPLPVADFTTGPVCENAPTDFKDNSSISLGNIVGWNYKTFGDALPGSSTQKDPTYTYPPPAAGTYTTWLVVTSDKGCKDSISKPVIVNPNPVALFGPPADSCGPVCRTIYDSSIVAAPGTIASWSWDLGNGNSTVQDPNNCWNDPGTYTVSLTVVTDQGCTASLTRPDLITVRPHPVADFSFDPAVANYFDPTFSFYDQSQGGPVVWAWDFGDQGTLADTANTQNSTYHYSSEINDFQTYDVTLYIENQYGCPATITKPVKISPEWTFFVPNTFTPNDDGVNDVFYGTGIGIKEKEMWIYDRWGNEIYYTNDLYGSWNGKVQGGGSNDVAQIDTYVWLIRIKDVFGDSHRYIGHVNIVK